MPPREIARLRDLTRYRTKRTQERVRETQRIQKLLEDAGIKLDSVATDVLGKASRRMLEALIAGERDPEILAQMALTRMRPKIPELRKAMVGHFDDHHALLLGMHLDHVDRLSEIIGRLDEEVDRLMAPFAEAATRLLSIPGVAKRSAEVMVAEISVDMSRFPTAFHLASWAGLSDAALSILAFATGNRDTADRLHDAFMSEVLAKLAVNERFALPVREVEAWLTTHGAGSGAGGRHRRQALTATAATTTSAAGEPPWRNGRGASTSASAGYAVRVDATAVTVGLLTEVEPAMWLPAEPVRRQLEALVFDTGDDIGVVAVANGLDGRWAAAVVAGAVTRVDLPHVRHVCEGLRCTPYDLWGTAGARSISHAYGPDAWPAWTEPLLPVDGIEADGISPSDDWPGVAAGAEMIPTLAEPAAPELVRDFGPAP